MLAFPYKGGLSRFANLAGEARCPASLRREGKLQLSQGTAVENRWPRKFQKVSARQSLGRPLREADERNAKASRLCYHCRLVQWFSSSRCLSTI